jgi:hypothetical protein
MRHRLIGTRPPGKGSGAGKIRDGFNSLGNPIRIDLWIKRLMKKPFYICPIYF